MATVLSIDKWYIQIANKIRNNLGGSYKPSEIPNAILEAKGIYDSIQAGATYDNNLNVKHIGDKIYPGEFTNTNITEFVIPESNTDVPSCAFAYSKLSNVTLHENITSIKTSAFRYCPLTNITLPSSLTTIRDDAFFGSDLVSIDIPSNVSTISSSAFNYCKNLITVIVRSTSSICRLLNESVFDNTPIAETDTTKTWGYIYVPSALVSTYKANEYWSEYKDHIRAIEDYPDICGTTTT